MTPLILGSTSPRRRELLSYFSYPFAVVAPGFDELSVPFNKDGPAYVTTLAKGKARSLLATHPDSVILTADTVVVQEEEVFNKPADRQEAIAMVTRLAGRWHSVFTGVAVAFAGTIHTEVTQTHVLLNDLSEAQIARYVDDLHTLDKAGGFLIQGPGSLIVNRIEGCYYNVVGLPLNSVQRLLDKVGIDLWHFLAHPSSSPQRY